MIKIKDPDHDHEDHIWVIEIDYGSITLVTHHVTEIEVGDYAYLKSPRDIKEINTLYELDDLTDTELLGARVGISEKYGICTVVDVIGW